MEAEQKPQRTKQEILDDITAYQEKLRQRRSTKVTPESLQLALDERRAARQEKAARREPGGRAKKVKLAITTALLVATGVIALGISSANKSFDAESAINQQTIAGLRDELRAVRPAGKPVDRAEDLQAQLSTARTKAVEVATLQQEFARLMRKASTEDPAENGAPGSSFLAAVEQRRDLAPYFDPESYVVDGEAAYRPNSTNTFDSEEIDPRYPWYVRYEPGADRLTAASSSTYAWTLASVSAPDSGDRSWFDVTWVCEDEKTGDLLAWATARYVIDSETFNTLTVGTTTVGDRYAAESGEQ